MFGRNQTVQEKLFLTTNEVLDRTIINEAAAKSPVKPIYNMGQGFLCVCRISSSDNHSKC